MGSLRTCYKKKNLVPKMLSVNDITVKYGFHPNTIRKWARDGEIKYKKHGAGGKLFFRQIDIDRYINLWYGSSNPNEEEK